ncbi:NYN domain-containing protein [Clostridiaceae bacterium 35-E11]
MSSYLFIDGYNVINAWPELKKIGRSDLEEARDCLIAQLVDYQSYTGETVIIVFDAHLVKGSNLKQEWVNGVEVVFTKELQTADSYIEKKVEELAKMRKNKVRVATSDWAEQQVVLGSGAIRISARELKLELDEIKKNIRKKTEAPKKIRSTLEERIDKKIIEHLEKWRRKQ